MVLHRHTSWLDLDLCDMTATLSNGRDFKDGRTIKRRKDLWYDCKTGVALMTHDQYLMLVKHERIKPNK